MVDTTIRDLNSGTAIQDGDLFISRQGADVEDVSVTGLQLKDYVGSGTGTVETVSVASANGFAGTSDGDPVNPEITLSTTVTGIVKGNGTSLSAAVAGTDYVTASSANTFTNKTFDADGTGNSITNIENADIKAAAAIAVSKLAALTANRAVITDASGFISPATTTATEIGYVNGVTSAIQSQINLKAPLASPTFTGTVTLPAGQIVNGVELTDAGSSTDYLSADGTYSAPPTGAVDDVSNSDGSLTISPTTGNVVASLNVGNANTWTGKQTFNTSSVRMGTLTASTALIADANKDVVSSAVTSTELGYVSGVTSAIQTQINGKQATGNYITALTGDVTASGPGSVAATLATVNANVGTFGSSTSIPTFTVNGKGLITAASGNVVIAPAGTLTGTTLNSTVVTSSLTSVGTLGSLTMGGTLAMGTNNITSTGSIGATGARLTKGWFTDLEVTNAIAGSITGNAATATALQNARTIGGTSFDGTANIVPATITVADTTDTTCFVGLWESATGDLGPKTDAGATYNASTGVLTATGFAGPLTGNASTATALQNARTIGGVSFDGTANIVPQTIQIVDAGGDTTTFPMLATSATGSLQPTTDPGLSYNATTNALTTTTFIGALTGNADTATTATTATNGTVANEATDTTCFPLFVTAATGNLPFKSNASLTFNSNTGALGATSFSGAGTGLTGTGSSFTAGTATVANTVSTANEATDTTCFPLFVTASGTQSLQPKNNTSLTFNSNTGSLGATNFNGVALTTAGAATNFLNGTGAYTAPVNVTLGSPTASTSGTTIDYTSIPSTVKKITVSFVGVSTNGTSNIIVQIGDSGGIETTGYLGSCTAAGVGAANFTTGFGVSASTVSTSVFHGTLTMVLVDSATFTWAYSSVIGQSDGALTHDGAGSKSLTATLDRIRITMINGTDTFDAGKVNIQYES